MRLVLLLAAFCTFAGCETTPRFTTAHVVGTFDPDDIHVTIDGPANPPCATVESDAVLAFGDLTRDPGTGGEACDLGPGCLGFCVGLEARFDAANVGGLVDIELLSDVQPMRFTATFPDRVEMYADVDPSVALVAGDAFHLEWSPADAEIDLSIATDHQVVLVEPETFDRVPGAATIRFPPLPPADYVLVAELAVAPEATRCEGVDECLYSSRRYLEVGVRP